MAVDTVASGSALGPYLLESVLGRGGMGIVYRAVDTRLGRPVALKLVQKNVAAEIGMSVAELRARLRHEAQLGARIAHANVVTVYAYEEVGDDSLVAMELVDGPTLAELLAKGQRWAPVEAARIIAEAADGVAAAHRLGIVHRDLKPANLILTRDGRCKVLDFGIAKLTTADGAQAVSRTTFGTVQYMAPEQVLGRATSPATDVWALATIAYELVAGTTLFSKGSAISSATQITRGVRFETGREWTTPNDQAVVFAQETGELFPFLQRALSADPKSRYSDGTATRDALWGAIGSVPTPSWVRPTTPPPVRIDRRVSYLLAAIALMLVIVAAGIYFMTNGPARVASIGGGTGYAASPAQEFAPPLNGPMVDLHASVAAPAPARTSANSLHDVQLYGDSSGYRFEPGEIIISPGDSVRFTVVTGSSHNVSFDVNAIAPEVRDVLNAAMPERTAELAGKMLISAGDSYTVSFAGVRAGRYPLFCSAHLAMNMRGAIVVLPSDEVYHPAGKP